MHFERFSGILLEGHKEAAVEFPYDPTHRWGLPAVKLEPGRHGHRVQGKINGIEFQSVIVPRAGKFWVLVSDEIRVKSSAVVGERVDLTIRPLVQLGLATARPIRRGRTKPGAKP